MGKGGSSPKPADTVGAARETGEQARLLNEAQTIANRPNQSNAWGTTTWESTPVWDATTGQYVNQWTQRETLNPKMQAALDAQMNIDLGRANLAQGAMARAWEDYSDPMNFDQYGNPIGLNADTNAVRSRAEDAAYQRQARRLAPQFESQRQALQTKLRNQGLQAGDQAYDAAMQNLAFQENDAYEAARLSSITEGRAESGQMFDQMVQENQIANALRQQQVEEDLFKRGYNLDEVERLLGGTEISGGPPSTGGQTQTDTIAQKSLGGG